MCAVNELITVVVPVYNAENYLSECIESIIKQTYKNWELILVNDGSSDSSDTICKKYVTKDERIRYISKENGGVSSARNAGIASAKGNYIAFVDSDDFISEIMLSELIAQKADFAMCGYELFDDFTKSSSLRYECHELHGDIAKLAINISEYLSPPFLLGPCFKLFRMEIINNNNFCFPLELSYGEDAVFVFEYLQKCSTISINSQVGYSYRKHGNMTLSSKFRKDKIDINKRINNLIENFMSIHMASNTNEVVSNRLLNNFVSYTQELIKSELPFLEKKQIFYKKYKEYRCDFAQPKRLSQRMVVLAGNCDFLYWIIYLFAIKK